MAWTSYIEIDVKRFREIGQVTTTTVEMKLYRPGTTEPYKSDNGVVSDGVVTLVGSYFVKVKRKVDHPEDNENFMLVKFWIKPENGKTHYMLQGVAFSNRDPSATGNKLGELDFPEIHIGNETVPSGKEARVFTIKNRREAGKHKTDPNQNVKASYDYLFLIQKIDGGAIGIIDPEWENEPQ